MSKISLKSLCEAAESCEVNNCDELCTALPNLFALKQAIDSMAALIKTAKPIYEELSDKCTKYALKHPSCFNDGLCERGGGINYGDITIGKVTYHFVNGFKGFKRLDENCALTKDFLLSLPQEYKEYKEVLNNTALSALPDTDLAAIGLRRGENNVWSVKED